MASLTKVTVKQGTIRGGTDFLPNGKPYYFFRGVPYAEPPLGKLRFKAPIPLESFVVPEIDCTKEGNVCFQRGKSGIYIGSEDCLFLNIYTPKIDSEGMLPVMVYIPGGAFLTGSGNSENYSPLYLMQENVVVVTMNYRLGPLGFLSFPEGNIPGNAGLKDQRLVLQWVQENISKFGGDHNNVTLFGQSAGGVCAHLHVLSERSRKLFHKAILQSGLGNMTYLLEDKSSHKTMELAKTLGCTSNNPIDVIEFLQHQDLEKIFEPSSEPPRLEDLCIWGSVPARPSIEEESSEAVFTKNALESMNDKNSIDIPIIIGCNSADGTAVLPAIIGTVEYLENKLRYLIPDAHSNWEILKDLELVIKEFYFKEQKIDKSTLGELNNLLTDFLFMMPTIEVVEMHSRMQHKSPMYFYIFEFVGALNLRMKKHKLENVVKGAGHCDELCYIFQAANAPEPWNKRERTMVQNICKMWTNFAKFNDPTIGCDWMPVRKIEDKEDYSLEAYIIDDTMKMVKNRYKERRDFWVHLKRTISSLLKTS